MQQKELTLLCPGCDCRTLKIVIITPSGLISRIKSITSKKEPDTKLLCTTCGYEERSLPVVHKK